MGIHLDVMGDRLSGRLRPGALAIYVDRLPQKDGSLYDICPHEYHIIELLVIDARNRKRKQLQEILASDGSIDLSDLN